MTHPADMTPEERAAATRRARETHDRVGALILSGRTQYMHVRADQRDENGMQYCGRPRTASAKHAQMRKAAYGTKSHFDSIYT
jgi:hypothetical protein